MPVWNEVLAFIVFIGLISADHGCLGLSMLITCVPVQRQDFRAGLSLVLFCRSGFPCFSGQLWLGRAQGGRHGLVRAVRAVSGAVSLLESRIM